MPDWVIWVQGPLGALVGALVVIVGMVRGDIVPGRLHERIVTDLKAQIKEWRDIAEPSLNLATDLMRDRATKRPGGSQ